MYPYGLIFGSFGDCQTILETSRWGRYHVQSTMRQKQWLKNESSHKFLKETLISFWLKQNTFCPFRTCKRQSLAFIWCVRINVTGTRTPSFGPKCVFFFGKSLNSVEICPQIKNIEGQKLFRITFHKFLWDYKLFGLVWQGLVWWNSEIRPKINKMPRVNVVQINIWLTTITLLWIWFGLEGFGLVKTLKSGSINNMSSVKVVQINN